MTPVLQALADRLCGGRLVFVLEGGYNLALARGTHSVLQVLAGAEASEPGVPVAWKRLTEPCSFTEKLSAALRPTKSLPLPIIYRRSARYQCAFARTFVSFHGIVVLRFPSLECFGDVLRDIFHGSIAVQQVTAALGQLQAELTFR